MRYGGKVVLYAGIAGSHIKGFNSHAISISEEQAFKALDNLKYKNYKEDKWKGVKSENDFIKILKEALEA